LFDYERRAGRQVDFPRPGQLFYGWQKFEGWPASMAANRRPFAVLYGPPSLTRLARAAIVDSPGITALGHIFSPNIVDFGPQRDSLAGLRSTDMEIRNYDPPLYLARVIERCEGVPVIELAPGENWLFETALPDLESAAIIPCLPIRTADPDWMRLYWALTIFAYGRIKGSDSDPAPHGDDHFLPAARKSVDQRIDLRINKYHRLFAQLRLHSPGNPACFPLYWGAPSSLDNKGSVAPPPKNQDVMTSYFGDRIAPLAARYSAMQGALSGLTTSQILDQLPDRWRLFFRDDLAYARVGAEQETEVDSQLLEALRTAGGK
jgi:hypothetical protein